MSSANPQVRAKFTGLDVLRGVAAISVALFHMTVALNLPWLVPNGWLAVDLFFVMSGFVIAHAYDSRIPELGFAGFMRLRLIRFYPLYILGLSIGILRQLLLNAVDSHELSLTEVTTSTLAALVFLPAPPSAVSDPLAPLNLPAWSLIFEIWINAAYALLFRFVTTPILLVVVTLAGASIFLATTDRVAGLGNADWHDIAICAARVIYSFPLGVLIYRGRSLFKIDKSLSILGIAVAVLCFMLPYGSLYACIFVVIISPLIIVFCSNCDVNRSISNYCGVMSYFMYAVHLPVLLIGIGVANRLGLPAPVIVVGVILAILLAAPVVDRYYDRPLRKRMSAIRLSKVSMTDIVRRWIVR